MKKEWKQKEFMLSGFMMTWHIDREAMDTYAALLKEAGIDLLIPYAASPLDFPMQRLYEACEKNHIQILTGIREIVTDEEDKPKAKGITYQPAEVDEERIRREVTALREKYPTALAGHYLWDEPGMNSSTVWWRMPTLLPSAIPACCPVTAPMCGRTLRWFLRPSKPRKFGHLCRIRPIPRILSDTMPM